jgi:hypothetical protein
MNTSPCLAAIVIAERQRALIEAADKHRLVREAMTTDVPEGRGRWPRLWQRRRHSAVINTAEPEQSGLPLYPTTA